MALVRLFMVFFVLIRLVFLLNYIKNTLEKEYMADPKYTPTSLQDYLVLIVALITPQLIGFLGAISTQTGLSSWYQELIKPFFNPPSWLFGPVWTVLYLFIGLVFYFLYKDKRVSWKTKKVLMVLFLIQLVLNGIWTPIFFGMQNLFWGMVVIVVLDVVLLTLLYKFRNLRLDLITLLWAPYALWVLFATLLNVFLWLLN